MDDDDFFDEGGDVDVDMDFDEKSGLVLMQVLFICTPSLPLLYVYC